MIDTSKYEWLQKDINSEAVSKRESDVRAILTHINKRDWKVGKKNAVATYFLSELEKGNVPPFKNAQQMTKYLKDIPSSKGYKEDAGAATVKDKREFTIYGVVLAFAFAIALYFMAGVIKGNVALNPMIQVVISAIGLAVTAYVYRKRYEIILKYTDETNTYMLHDAIFVIMALLVKFLGRSVIDITLILMGLDVYFTSKDLNETIENVIE